MKGIIKRIRAIIDNRTERALINIAETNSLLIESAILNQKTFEEYKNVASGKSVVICGAGPTLNEYRPIHDAVHIACNRAFLYNKVKFDFIFCQDFEGIQMVQDELIAYRPDSCTKLFSQHCIQPQKQIPESLAIKCNARRFITDEFIYCNGYRSKFVSDIDYRPIGNMPNVGMSVLQFALFMNPDKLYIVGCDMNGSHFATGNQSVNQVKREEKIMEEEWSNNYNRLLTKWKELKEDINRFYPNTEIISVNPIGLKGVFKDYYQN